MSVLPHAHRKCLPNCGGSSDNEPHSRSLHAETHLMDPTAAHTTTGADCDDAMPHTDGTRPLLTDALKICQLTQPNHLISSGPPPSSRWPTVFEGYILALSQTADTLLRSGMEVCEYARFGRAVNLLVDHELIAIVTPELGAGPFHVVVDCLPPFMDGTRTIARSDALIRIDPWQLWTTERTALWNDRPVWHHIHLRPEQICRLRHLTATAALEAKTRAGPMASPFLRVLWGAATPSIAALGQALVGNNEIVLTDAAAVLAGLGPGLTPSGDDLLCGVIFALWASHHPAAQRLSQIIVRAACPRTTRISRAYLAAAGNGRLDQKWQTLLAALSQTQTHAVDAAANAVLQFGATSGLDTLIGFLWTLDTCLPSGTAGRSSAYVSATTLPVNPGPEL